MKVTLLVVGKTTDPHIIALIDDYKRRLTHYLPFEMVVIPELKNAKNLTEEQQKQQEGELILKTVGKGNAAHVVLLDEHGRAFRSVEFADYLQKRMSAGMDTIFVVGGPYGFSPEVYARANEKISLSKMTFSHQMVRLFFVEQVYRAMTILRSEPYHHE